ncbi:hypothetical protein GCM10009611_04080 [Arthrobacter roseus]|nr:DUF6153 family protein [Arthrobacter roseus]
MARVAAVVIGILAMHMWMGAGMGGQETPNHATSAVVTSPFHTGQNHLMAPPTAHEMPSPAGAVFAMDCGGEMIAGACAMMFLVISIVVALALRSRSNYRVAHYRVLPRITLPHRTRPYTPSLVQLCISRT